MARSRSGIIKALRSCQNARQRAQIICQHRLAFHGIMTTTQLLRIERYYQGDHHDQFNQHIDSLITRVIARKWRVELPPLSPSPKSLTASQFVAMANQRYTDTERIIRKQRTRIRRQLK